MFTFKSIIFDLSDVLIKGFVGSEQHLGQFHQKIQPSDFFISELDDFFLGKISEEGYWMAVLKKNKWSLSVGDLQKAVRKNFEEIEGTRKIIKKLRKKYKLGLLSVHTKEWVEYCEKKLGYTSLFDVICYSFETSVCKPDKRAFKIMLNSLKSRPEESIFVDDSPKNIRAAEELGLMSILFQSAPQLKKDLSKLGINEI